MSKEILTSLAGTAAGGYRNLMGRAVRVGGPAGGLVSLLGDLGAPVADFSMILFCGCAGVTVFAGWMWLGKRARALRAALADGKITKEELDAATASNGWSVTFAFGLVASIIFGITFAVQALLPKKPNEPNRGIIATLVPQIQTLQDSVFNLQKDVTDIKATTAATKDQTGRIETKTDQVLNKLDDLSKAFEEASKKDGLIADPQTLAEHYHNARYSELKGDFAGARRAYTAYLASGAEFIDPCLGWLDMLKVQDGVDGAREVVTAMQKTNTTLSMRAAAALLLPASARKGTLAKLAEAAPEFAPAFYLLSRESSAEKLGEQTIADKAAEKAALEKFRALNEKGGFQKYVLDKKEAKKWLDDADARWAKLAATPDAVLKTPVTLTTQQTNQGWNLIFGFADFKLKKVEYRLDGQGEFKDTGSSAAANPQTGLPMPNVFVDAGKLTEGEHKVEVRYVDMTDKLNGPYTLTFNTTAAALTAGKQMLNQFSSSWLSWRDYDGKTLLYFTALLTQRASLKAIRYSIDGDSLDKTFPFKAPKPGEGPNEIGDGLPYIEVPAAAKSATVELEFADGTKSEKKSFPR